MCVFLLQTHSLLLLIAFSPKEKSFQYYAWQAFIGSLECAWSEDFFFGSIQIYSMKITHQKHGTLVRQCNPAYEIAKCRAKRILTWRNSWWIISDDVIVVYMCSTFVFPNISEQEIRTMSMHMWTSICLLKSRIETKNCIVFSYPRFLTFPSTIFVVSIESLQFETLSHWR